MAACLLRRSREALAAPVPALARRSLGLAAAAAVAAVAATVAVPRAVAQEVEVGRSVSTSRTLVDWKSFFGGDMRELVSRSETTTVYEAKDNPPRRVGGADLDLARRSPIETKSTSRYVAKPDDPEYGTIRVQSQARAATGEVVENAFSFKEDPARKPIAVGPIEGQVIEVPPHERRFGGRSLDFRTTSRTVEIVALLVAPTFEDLIAGRNVREVREPGTRLQEGSLRVVSSSGEPIGFYAGDVRVSHGVDRVTPR